MSQESKLVLGVAVICIFSFFVNFLSFVFSGNIADLIVAIMFLVAVFSLLSYHTYVWRDLEV